MSIYAHGLLANQLTAAQIGCPRMVATVVPGEALRRMAGRARSGVSKAESVAIPKEIGNERPVLVLATFLGADHRGVEMMRFLVGRGVRLVAGVHFLLPRRDSFFSPELTFGRLGNARLNIPIQGLLPPLERLLLILGAAMAEEALLRIARPRARRKMPL